MDIVRKLLLRRRIVKFEPVHDYVQFCLSDGSILNIFNGYRVVGGSDADIIGDEVAELISTEGEVCLIMSSGRHICVAIGDADYRGAEAMEYIGPDGARVVWS